MNWSGTCRRILPRSLRLEVRKKLLGQPKRARSNIAADVSPSPGREGRGEGDSILIRRMNNRVFPIGDHGLEIPVFVQFLIEAMPVLPRNPAPYKLVSALGQSLKRSGFSPHTFSGTM
jgi:hypothetical protein